MSMLLLHQRRGKAQGGYIPPDPDPPPPSILLGVGSDSTSLTDYPKTPTTTTGNWYVDGTSGSNSNSGTSAGQAFATIQRALSEVSDGETILIREGTYNLSSTITRSTNWTTGIRVMGYGAEVPVINSSAGTGIRLNGRREHWCGIRVRGPSLYGIRVDGSFNTLERMYVHDCATAQYGVGIIVIESTASDNLIQDSVIWRLGVPGATGTNTPDGITFTASSGTYNQRNVGVRCLVANATDDCFDMYRSRNSKWIDCVALGGGYYYDGNADSDEGHGFKMGGGGGQDNEATGCIAVSCRRTGFNSNGAANADYYNITAVSNNYGIEFRGAGASGYSENAIALGNSTNVPNDQHNTLPPGSSLVNNSWQEGVNLGNVDFADTVNGDYSLGDSSSARGTGSGGEHLGASTVALELLKEWWNHSGIWIPGRGTGPGGTGLPGDTSPEQQTIIYTVDDTTDFLNPERGWMTRGTQTTHRIVGARDPKTWSEDHPIGYSVVWSNPLMSPWDGSSGSPFRLDNYRTSDLPQSLLTELQNIFDTARAEGVKMKIRFSYNFGSGGQDATQARIQGHVAQLSPVLMSNSDVIATMDIGFIGLWGEMHGSTHLVDSNNDWWEEPWISARNAVTNSVMDATPDWMSIGNRYPLFAREMYSNYEIDEDDRFSTRQSRLGVYNDCFIANRSNVGTYSFDICEAHGNLGRATFATISRYACASMETCDIGGTNSYNTGAASIAEMEIMNIDLLFRQFWVGIYNRWIDTGHYDEISRRLGYRLALTTAELPAVITPGQPMTVELTIENSGFGKVYNPRPIDLTLTSGATSHRVRLTADARRDLPLGGETKTLTYTVTAPSLPSGTFSAHLTLPDPHVSIENDPRYSIRLANTGTWNGTSGRNNLNATITVGNA